MCGNSTNCHTFHSQAVSSTGCFLQWLKLSASVCCKIEVSVYSLNTVFRSVDISCPERCLCIMVTLVTVFPQAPDI